MLKVAPGHYLLSFIVIGWLLLTGNIALAEQKHMLWQVGGTAQKAYLFGSIHVGKESMYPLADIISAAYHSSDTLVVEIDMLTVDAAAVARMAMIEGMYPGLDNNLKHNISGQTWQLVNNAASHYGFPIEYLQQQKPWFLALTLALHVYNRLGYEEQFGIDLYFLQQAHANGRDVISLETPASQLQLFNRLNAREQEEMLRQTLQDIAKGEAYLGRLFTAWENGDADDINTVMNESLRSNPSLGRAYELLLTERNIAMADKIIALMATGKTLFVVVGAAHLAGPDSIVRLLRDKGYQLIQH